jgi:hypothetical protein
MDQQLVPSGKLQPVTYLRVKGVTSMRECQGFGCHTRRSTAKGVRCMRCCRVPAFGGRRPPHCHRRPITRRCPRRWWAHLPPCLHQRLHITHAGSHPAGGVGAE